MATEEYLLEIVKIMVPLLTGFLAFAAGGISKSWASKPKLTNGDRNVVVFIGILAFLSMGCWGGTLAGAMIYSTGGGGSILGMCVTNAESLRWARTFTGVAFLLFMLTVFSTAIYYLKIRWSARSETDSQDGSRASQSDEAK